MRQILLACAFASVAFAGEEIKLLKLTPPPGMTRADLFYRPQSTTPRGVLVLSPGANGSGESYLRSADWIQFAKEHDLGIVGLSFASNGEDLHNGKGYYYAGNGSGKTLLEGIRQIYGRELPLVLYGFSGGAHFSGRFAEWAPEKVLAWCAYSAGWWEEPKVAKVATIGLIACGDEDPRYGACLMYFKQGRAAGRNWCWLSVPRNGHSPDPAAIRVIRRYLSLCLSSSSREGIYVDVDLETETSAGEAVKMPSLTAWLPDRGLFDLWREVHRP